MLPKAGRPAKEKLEARAKRFGVGIQAFHIQLRFNRPLPQEKHSKKRRVHERWMLRHA